MRHATASGTLVAAGDPSGDPSEEVDPMPDIRLPGPRWAWGLGLGVLVAVVVAAVALAGRSAPPAAAPPAAGPGNGQAAPATFPLTGLPVRDQGRAARPALSVKVENVAAARPQAGLNAADLVTEELVEGGLTRLLVTYQSQDAALVGPVRSVRPVDAPLLRQLGGGLFGFSGGATAVLDLVRRSSDAILLAPEQAPGAYRRLASHPAPHNLFTSTEALYQAGRSVDGGLGPPDPLFGYSGAAPAGASTVRRARLRFSLSSLAAWQWQTGSGTFVRYQDGTLHRQADGRPVTTENVVVLSTRIGRTSVVDAAGNPTPDVVVTGEGTAWVLRDGRLVKGSWRRPSEAEPVRLLDAAGEPLTLHPGRTWVELLPSSQQPSFG
jgi:Protein of unknown function (DUF3048) N-terminal domain/Protein of unknown function (DUF3048) C-terminal domain